MKAFDQFLLAAVAAAFLPVIAFSQPCLRVNGESELSCLPAGADPFTSLDRQFVFKLGEPNAGIDSWPGDLNARYKTFWIFGDGNFRSFPDGSAAVEQANQTQGYTYERTGTFNPMVVLIEKKSNTTPPPSLVRPINIDIAAPAATASPFVTTLSPGEWVRIVNSERNRPEYETAFVVSARLSDPTLSGLFFFCNSLKIQDTDPFRPLSLHILEESTVSRPQYLLGEDVIYLKVPGDLNGGSFTMSSTFVNTLDNVYANFTYAPLTAAIRADIPSTFSEFRYFPVLKSIWNGNDWVVGQDTFLPQGKYLAIAVCNTPRNSASDTTGYYQLLNQVNNIFKDPPLTPDFYIGMIGGDSVFICGIDELEVPMVLAIDPNELEVEQICPIDAERYRVQMRMQVCNEGPGHIGKFTFRLIDHTGGKLGQPVFPESHDITFLPATSPTALPEWQFEWETYLDGVPLPGTNYDADEIHTCATARFVLTTDWLGVQALSEGGALELCVKFPNMPDTCSLSYGFKDFCREGGYRCEECPNNVHVCKTALCCKWIWVLVVLVVLVLLIQLWMLYTSKQPAKSKKVKKMKKE